LTTLIDHRQKDGKQPMRTSIAKKVLDESPQTERQGTALKDASLIKMGRLAASMLQYLSIEILNLKSFTCQRAD
jgi:hypothetical protein